MTAPRHPQNPTAERRRDEMQLLALQLWDDAWSAGEIADLEEIAATRNAVIGWIGRIHKSDPGCLRRKPQRSHA